MITLIVKRQRKGNMGLRIISDIRLANRKAELGASITDIGEIDRYAVAVRASDKMLKQHPRYSNPHSLMDKVFS
jgi:hypothetical protein